MTKMNSDLIELLEVINNTENPKEEYNQLLKTFGFKLLQHAKSIQLLSKNSYDISSIIAISRAQLETYSTFYFLFIRGSNEERLLRYYLWKLDGLSERQKFNLFLDDFDSTERDEFEKQHKKEKLEVDLLKEEIIVLPFFSTIPDNYQKVILKNSRWKFDKEQTIKQKKIVSYSIKGMIDNTDLKKDYIEDMYSFFSMHSHTNYISILQNQQISEESFNLVARHTVRYATILVVYYINAYTSLLKINMSKFGILYESYLKSKEFII